VDLRELAKKTIEETPQWHAGVARKIWERSPVSGTIGAEKYAELREYQQQISLRLIVAGDTESKCYTSKRLVVGHVDYANRGEWKFCSSADDYRAWARQVKIELARRGLDRK